MIITAAKKKKKTKNKNKTGVPNSALVARGCDELMYVSTAFDYGDVTGVKWHVGPPQLGSRDKCQVQIVCSIFDKCQVQIVCSIFDLFNYGIMMLPSFFCQPHG